MRVAVLSDIHGNAAALDAVLEDVVAAGPFDQIVVAGDLVWSGPHPAQVVDRVIASGAIVVQGNCDAFFLRSPSETPLGKSQERFAAQLSWMQHQLGRDRCRYLAHLPFAHRISPARGQDLLIVHANPVDLDQAITAHMSDEALDALLLPSVQQEPWAVLAFGHVHIPFTRQWRGRLLVNVASAGLSMDGDPRAAWAILTWDGVAWRAEHRRVFYAVQVVAHAMRSCGMPRGKHFAERLMTARYSALDPAPVMVAD